MKTGGVLAIVPARGGSKGLSRKNLRLLGGHPLTGWAVQAGVQAAAVERTICTTDDPEIAAVAKAYGAEVPFLRPPELAQDTTLDLPVFIHTLDWLADRENWQPEFVIHLRPTSPFRGRDYVDHAVRLLRGDPQCTSVRSVCRPAATPFKMWRLSKGGRQAPYMLPLLDIPGNPEPFNSPRQALPAVYWHNGIVDAMRVSTLYAGSMTGPRILPLLVDERLAVDIDTELDLHVAEVLAQEIDCVRPAKPLPWKSVRLLALDCDGTLTPGSMYYDGTGEVLKRFHTHDGHGISAVQALGVEVALITRERSDIPEARARKLGFSRVHTGILDKVQTLRAICEQEGIGFSEVAYIGDDQPDLEVMAAVAQAGGISCAPSDARREARAAARFLCGSPGGRGAVRDVCDLIAAAKR